MNKKKTVFGLQVNPSSVVFLFGSGLFRKFVSPNLPDVAAPGENCPPFEVSSDARFDGPNRLVLSSYLSAVAAGRMKSVADVSFIRRPNFALFSLRRMFVASFPSVVAGGRVFCLPTHFSPPPDCLRRPCFHSPSSCAPPPLRPPPETLPIRCRILSWPDRRFFS